MEMAANANASAAQVQCMEGRGSQEGSPKVPI